MQITCYCLASNQLKSTPKPWMAFLFINEAPLGGGGEGGIVIPYP